MKKVKGADRPANATSATGGDGVIPGDLPRGWRIARLGEIVLRPRQRDPRRLPDTPFEYVDVSSLSRDELRIRGTTRLLGRDAPSRARKEVKAGDVLFATVRPALRRVASVPPGLDGQICSTAFCVLRADPDLVDPGFLFFATAFDDFVRRVAEHQGGSSYPAVTESRVLNERIPLPQLAEQRAIAQALRAVQRLKEAYEQVIAATRQLKEGLLHHFFTYGPAVAIRAHRVKLRTTEFGAVPASWSERPLSACATVQTGVAKGRRLNSSDVVELPYLRVANVQEGRLDVAEMKTIQLRAKEVQRYLLQPGDVVLTEGGDFDKLGRGFTWRGEVSPCVHQNHVFAVRVNEDLLTPEFLAYLVQSAYGKSYFLSVAHKTTNLACINATKLKALPVLVPPLPEQRLIAAYLAGVDAKLAAEKARRAALDNLFKSLLHHLMTGKIRVNHLVDQLVSEGAA